MAIDRSAKVGDVALVSPVREDDRPAGSPMSNQFFSVEPASLAVGSTLPKKRGSKQASVDLTTQERRQALSEIMLNCVKWYRQTRVQTVEELQDRLILFFDECAKCGEIPTVEKLALALGATNWGMLWDWENDRSRPGFSELIKKAKGLIGTIEADFVLNRKIPEVSYLFRAKNFHGMKDTQDLVITPNSPLGDTQDAATLAQKYAATLPPADTPRLSGSE